MLPTAIEAPSRRNPRFTRADHPPSFQITERDVEIVRHVARHRFLRSTHISQLLGASHKKILERLSPLYHAGYLDRPRAQLEYHVRGGGSAPFVYAMGNLGAQLLVKRDELDQSHIDWISKNRDTGREFLLHTLAVADFRVALDLACRPHLDITHKHPIQLLPTLPDATRAAHNPWSLRVRVQHKGLFQEIGVLPDYVFALFLADGRRRPFVVECDRGTMPVERSTLDRTSMLRKFLAYEGARQQRLYKARFGWENFRVLTITTSQERVETMCELINRTPTLKGSPLFLFANHATLMKSNVLKYCWQHASGTTYTLV